MLIVYQVALLSISLKDNLQTLATWRDVDKQYTQRLQVTMNL